MEAVSLSLFKKHVRADDFADDDELLEYYLNAATRSVINATNRTEAELLEMGGGVFPVELGQAIMLLGGHLYNQRESTSSVQMHEVPNSLSSLIKPYRKLVSDDSGTNEV